MEYFDVARFEVDATLAKRLGYKSIIQPSRIAFASGPTHGKEHYVFHSGDPGHLYKALKDPKCLGVVLKDSTIIKKTIEQINTNEKLLFFVASEFTNSEGTTLLRNLGRARLLYKFVKKAKAEPATISLAEDGTSLLSSMQMVEVAKLISGDATSAKRMASVLGDYL